MTVFGVVFQVIRFGAFQALGEATRSHIAHHPRKCGDPVVEIMVPDDFWMPAFAGKTEGGRNHLVSALRTLARVAVSSTR